MTKPELANDEGDGRVYNDTLPDCPLLEANGWSGPFTNVPSVTTINKVVSGGEGLSKWQRARVANWVMDRTDLWPTIEDHKPDPAWWERTVHKYADLAAWKGRKKGSVWWRALNEYQNDPKHPDLSPKEVAEAWQRKLVVDMAVAEPDRVARKAGDEGDYLHDVIETIAAGKTPVAMTPDEQVMIDQVKRWLDKAQPEFIHNERSAFSRTHGYAGTPDTFMKLPGTGFVLGDWKRKGADSQDIAYQLVAYERADYMIVGDLGRRRVAIPQVDGCVVVRFPPDGSDAICRPVYTTDRHFELFLGRLEQYKDRNQKCLGDPIEPPAVMPGDPDMRVFLSTCVTVLKAFYPEAADTLRERWPADLPTLKRFDGHSAAQLARIQRLLDDVEAAHQIPFGYADGSSNTNNQNNVNMETAAA